MNIFHVLWLESCPPRKESWGLPPPRPRQYLSVTLFGESVFTERIKLK